MTNLDSVASLSLTTRTYNALVKGRFSGPISTISELVQLSEDDLYRRRGMGIGTVDEIKASLAERGFFSPSLRQYVGNFNCRQPLLSFADQTEPRK
jgi:DNA-directed RNA polymerase alpha subunit